MFRWSAVQINFSEQSGFFVMLRSSEFPGLRNRKIWRRFRFRCFIWIRFRFRFQLRVIYIYEYEYVHTVLRIWIRDPVPFCPLDPGSGIGFFRIPDPGSYHYFWELKAFFLFWVFFSLFCTSGFLCPRIWKMAFLEVKLFFQEKKSPLIRAVFQKW